MDVRKALAYVFEDKSWVSKVMIAVLLTLFAWLIIPAFLLSGYMIAIIRRVRDGDPEPLPEWDDWGKLLRDGFLLFIAQVVYTLPLIIVWTIGFGTTIGFGSLAEVSEELATAGFMASFGIVGCLSLIFAAALLFLTPALAIQFAKEDELGACFRFGEVFGIVRDHVGDILITFLVILGASFVISLGLGLVGWIPCLGWIIALVVGLAVGPYITMVTGHMYGQIAAKVDGDGIVPKYVPEE